MSMLDISLVHRDGETGTLTDVAPLIGGDFSIVIDNTGVFNIDFNYDARFEQQFFNAGDVLEVYLKHGILNRTSLATMSTNNTPDLIGSFDVKTSKLTTAYDREVLRVSGQDRTAVLNDYLYSKVIQASQGYRVAVSGGDSSNSLIHSIVEEINFGLGISTGSDKITVGTVDTTNYPLDNNGVPKTGLDFIADNRPAGDVIVELSNNQYTAKGQFIAWIDNLNRLHFRRKTPYGVGDSITTSGAVYSDSAKFSQYTHEKKIEVSNNMIIFNSGNDLNGNAIWWYYVDVTAAGKAGTIKQTVRAYTDIAKNLATVSGITNANLRQLGKDIGRARAKSELDGLAGPRDFVTIELDGTNLFSKAEVYNHFNDRIGWTRNPDTSKRLRIKAIRHAIRAKAWTTTVEFGEDEVTLTGGT